MAVAETLETLAMVGVIIEVIEDVPNDRYVVYWSDNIKSTHWATDLEVK